MLQAYSEGLGVDGAFLASRGTRVFEGFCLLAREFSLRSRAEAMTCKPSSLVLISVTDTLNSHAEDLCDLSQLF